MRSCKLNNVHDDFCAYGISAMKTAYCKDIYKGRPFGGVGFLWRNKLANNIKIIDKDINGRCLAISLNNGNGRCINMISVYFPCFVENKKYYSELTQCLGFLENIFTLGNEIVILGDFNFACYSGQPGFDKSNALFEQFGIVHCDDLFQGNSNDCFSYVNIGLKQQSFIDHIFSSVTIKSSMSQFLIIDSGINLSDHKPVMCVINNLHLSTMIRVIDTERVKNKPALKSSID